MTHSAATAIWNHESGKPIPLGYDASFYSQRYGRHAVDELVRQKLEAAMADAFKRLKHHTAAFTQNDHYLTSSKDKFLAQYKNARMNAKSSPQRATPTAPPSAPNQPAAAPKTPLNGFAAAMSNMSNRTNVSFCVSFIPGAPRLAGVPCRSLVTRALVQRRCRSSPPEYQIPACIVI